MKCCVALPVSRIDLCPSLNQHLCYSAAPMLCSKHQRSRVVLITGIHHTGLFVPLLCESDELGSCFRALVTSSHMQHCCPISVLCSQYVSACREYRLLQLS